MDSEKPEFSLPPALLGKLDELLTESKARFRDLEAFQSRLADRLESLENSVASSGNAAARLQGTGLGVGPEFLLTMMAKQVEGAERARMRQLEQMDSWAQMERMLQLMERMQEMGSGGSSGDAIELLRVALEHQSSGASGVSGNVPQGRGIGSATRDEPSTVEGDPRKG